MRVHIVQKGDTLWKIAKQYSIGFEDLKRLNAHLANPDYIVPGMEIILPDGGTKKEKEVMHKAIVKEQEKPVKPIVKEKPIVPTPVPTPTPVPVPLPVQPRPLWQGDFYYQPPAVPVQIPNWQQTHVHFQPTIEAPIMTPTPQPLPVPPTPTPMPIPPPVMPQPQPQPQPPIFIQPPIQHHCMPPMQHHCMPHFMPPMQHHCMPHFMPPMQHHCMQPMPMPICQNCHGIRMEDSPAFMPMYQEESPIAQMDHGHDRDQQVRHYYNEMQNMNLMPMPMPMPMPNSCGCQESPMMPMQNSCGCQQPPMMPYPTPYPMPMYMMPQMHPQMNPMPHPPKSCH
ncbi:hypothetical protein CSE16_14995 [Solibacillus sp. R5-41]|uniref:LysM peptidoglycan-binding domain-containing protein n=1 Tax=Solibacillus sp. R5-41 TaxID=2048654 RepID=UPI000C125CD9|nr:LysM peptidoglycan-binding domain-containing protein [Solibacillus sp. R5-41]ATP41257.1 hypothetical protein CSE16_14995 [Solibacillus sp. R5-41]